MEPWSRAAACARPAVQAPEQPWAQPQAAEQRQGSRSPRAGVKPADHGIAVGEALSEQSLRHDTGTPRRPPPPAGAAPARAHPASQHAACCSLPQTQQCASHTAGDTSSDQIRVRSRPLPARPFLPPQILFGVVTNVMPA